MALSASLTIILASGSPRRQRLLAALGLPFRVEVADIDETSKPPEKPADLACRLGMEKAAKIAHLYPDCIVIAADTLVAIDGRVLGKPRHEQEAYEMLSCLGNRRHTVFTGLATIHQRSARASIQVAETGVVMRDYDDQEIWRYIQTGDPMDKAGAYAIQHDGFDPVDHITQCYANVMGLPLCHLVRTLQDWQVPVPVHPLAACPYALDQGGCPWSAGILGPHQEQESVARR